MTVILNEQSTQGRYFVSETLNELILRGDQVGYTEIPADGYHNLYSPQKIREYEARLDQAPGATGRTPNVRLLIPMAGQGTRFAEAGYTTPKPFHHLAGTPLPERAPDNVALPRATVRPAERRVAKECDSTGSDRRSPCPY